MTTRILFVLLSLGIILLGGITGLQSYLIMQKNNELKKASQLNDSLQSELYIQSMELGKQQYIIEQAKVDNPKFMEKIIKNTE